MSEVRSNYTEARKKEREARKEYIKSIEKNFVAFGFVKIGNRQYNKKHLVWVDFGDDYITARFVTGDIIRINEEQLEELTS